MRVDYILSVIDSVEAYFLEELNLVLNRNDIEVREEFPSPLNGIFVDLKGEAEGKILVSFSNSLANYVVNCMMESDDAFDQELKIAALKELVNQISAKIINRLDEEGFDLEIGVPVVIMNGDPKLDVLQIESLVVPYQHREGNMEITVAIKEKKRGEI